MKLKFLALHFLILCSIFCYGQKTLYFEFIQDSSYKTYLEKYSLPRSVTCTFKDGSKQRLVVENVIGDSLVFSKYYNQKNFDCRFSSLKKIKIHKHGEDFLYFLCTGFILTSAILLTSSVYLLNVDINDPGDPSHSVGALLAIPLVITIPVTVILGTTLPKTYPSKKWKIYAK